MLRSLRVLVYRPLGARQTSALTIARALKRKWVKALQAEGIPEPELAVKYIVDHLTRSTNLHVGASLDDLVSRAESMLEQRRRRTPLQYIIGEWDFRNVTLKMKAPVLIPRPETEQLVDRVLTSCRLASRGDDGWVWFLDVGCGSGAISVALLAECPQLRGVAIDVSTEAVDLTRENAIKNNVHERLDVIHTTIGNCSMLTFGGRLFDILVSNPPYIPSRVLAGLDPEVLWFEDHRALEGGPDGLRVTAEVLDVAQSIVRKGGHIWLELTADLDLMQLMEQNPHWQLHLRQSYSDFADKILFHHLVTGQI